MTPQAHVFAERVAAVERHLSRVAERLPTDASTLRPMTDESDAIILHLWQAVQIVIDQALSACVRAGLGSPSSYAEAFRKLADAGYLEAGLATRLARAAGFRNVIAHAYDSLDMLRVHAAAKGGPADLRECLHALESVVVGGRGT
jgi:uncharacterized protein YutE (UPF0331/DUF86 family)